MKKFREVAPVDGPPLNRVKAFTNEEADALVKYQKARGVVTWEPVADDTPVTDELAATQTETTTDQLAETPKNSKK